ncbi:hypothetical protein H8K90_10945 [Winogradskyella echinorum]|uniref:DUF4134 domain-containing protein n=1 Tax=Winogradskyella echinorum TaxID=538189 RepID=A0ABR6Y2C0_9FLAO|nr:hypothetical protein [Winogradskyella echinorum]MBC3846897.1 hypothetical protein [Winogradskyella echinorum]MBC5751245.1 hypothetical protein [Winogradskyella echinorum]
MKVKLIVLLLCFGFINDAFGQVLADKKNQNAQDLYEFHIIKKKANNTSAWIVLSGGVAMIVGGYGINMSGGIIDNDSTNNKKGLWLSYLGGAVTLVSVPLFIASGKHNKKAKIQLENGAVGLGNKFSFSGVSFVFSF